MVSVVMYSVQLEELTSCQYSISQVVVKTAG